MSEPFYPYVLDPKISPAIWGGDALVTRYGKRGDASQTLGESWECWDDNRVINGAFAGQPLAGVRADVGRELTGRADPSRAFPVLTKIIDARAALSVQVHPDDAYAQRVEGQPNGKTECWFVLDCEPGAEIVLGWTRDTSREEYERRVADGTLGDLLRRVPVTAGDVFYLPAGTLHAIGAGIQIFETQQASDLTYRIFDWNRVDGNGKPRELHIAKAADVLDFRASTSRAKSSLTYADADGERTLLVGAARFVVERVTITGASLPLWTDGGPLAIMTLDAHVRVDVGAQSTVLTPWQTAVTPAECEVVVLVPGGEEVVSALIVRPDPVIAAIADRATRAGCRGTAVDAFFAQF